jgi:hypothetical protein
MKTFIVENTHLTRSAHMDFGWGNGYVIIPKGHPAHGKHYDQIDVDVNGGLTFSDSVENLKAQSWQQEFTEEDAGGWVVGFDTAHYMDTLAKWPKERVQEETDRLREQLEAMKPSIIEKLKSMTASELNKANIAVKMPNGKWLTISPSVIDFFIAVDSGYILEGTGQENIYEFKKPEL